MTRDRSGRSDDLVDLAKITRGFVTFADDGGSQVPIRPLGVSDHRVCLKTEEEHDATPNDRDHQGLNQGTAFTADERSTFGVHGLLPPHVESLDEQLVRAYEAYQRKDDDLERHTYLRALKAYGSHRPSVRLPDRDRKMR
jgi:hypothetical protein